MAYDVDNVEVLAVNTEASGFVCVSVLVPEPLLVLPISEARELAKALVDAADRVDNGGE